MTGQPRRLFRGLSRDVRTVVLSVLASSVVVGVQAAAAVYASNSDRVDGKHAVSSGATVHARKGKLVATSRTTGRLPNSIVAKPFDAGRLDGLDSTAFLGKSWRVLADGKSVPHVVVAGCQRETLASYPITLTRSSLIQVNGSTNVTRPAGFAAMTQIQLRDSADRAVAWSLQTYSGSDSTTVNQPGVHDLLWDSTDAMPSEVAPGRYVLHLYGLNLGTCDDDRLAHYTQIKLSHLAVPIA